MTKYNPCRVPLETDLVDLREFLAEIECVTGNRRTTLESDNRFRWRVSGAVKQLREAAEFAAKV
ncbi:hypothetical protein GCM10010329_28870 [Streptomyces spiroverticillatus]|uniref:Uncharacterized protein n=1 Tax=Streptomyces finlayi TaxID=67296 RepID=A0A918WVN9_9ACTN|nr:hypothetical protein [Streptomyces finlayi]GHA04468.1 hypothetical protein GCM10010329_28870 [Streptomyces spiroverticillatus]GHC88519.1 hypothetical protein GCM10010334_21280 [Streptomyces finlayi]